MTLSLFLTAAALLSVERISYLWIWHRASRFEQFCNWRWVKPLGGPVKVLKWLFCIFKLLQVAVFLSWCWFFAAGPMLPPDGKAWSVALGLGLVLLGQLLNGGVFYRLGEIGVFYGNKFGYQVPWCREFPFSVFRHPQYAGALLSIWGFFLIMRFPHRDWYWLPVVETLYYAIGARLEQNQPAPSLRRKFADPADLARRDERTFGAAAATEFRTVRQFVRLVKRQRKKRLAMSSRRPPRF